jgi:hypothetical protein
MSKFRRIQKEIDSEKVFIECAFGFLRMLNVDELAAAEDIKQDIEAAEYRIQRLEVRQARLAA